jgi:predicted XRE-type DNA-binding protein
MQAKIDKFAVDKLIDMLAIMGYSVVPKIKKMKAA